VAAALSRSTVQRSRSVGSGVIWHSSGLIITITMVRGRVLVELSDGRI